MTTAEGNMAKLRIIYHHRTAGDGVEGVHIMGMVRAFRALGHTVSICSPPGCRPESRSGAGAPAAGEGREGGLRARLKRFARRSPPVLFELAELGYNLYSLLGLGWQLRRGRPDLIYERATSNSFAPALVAGCLGIPIVQEVNVTSELGRFRPLVLSRLTKALERMVLRRASLVVTVSEDFKRRLGEAGLSEDHILACPNAIDPAEFSPDDVKPVRRPPGAFVAGYVGSFLPYHHLETLIDVARQLRPEYPHLTWLLVGDGVERPRVEALLDEHGLRNRFWLAGKVPHEDVPSYVAAMDVALLPNSGTFNSPMKLFEYMSMGRAVIAPRVPAIEEVVRHGETGLLFEPGSADSLRGAVELLMRDDGLRLSLGRNARECVLAHHTWTINARRVLEALKDKLKDRAKLR